MVPTPQRARVPMEPTAKHSLNILKKKLKVMYNKASRYAACKGQEISKAIFLETPLPKKRLKFFEECLP